MPPESITKTSGGCPLIATDTKTRPSCSAIGAVSTRGAAAALAKRGLSNVATPSPPISKRLEIIAFFAFSERPDLPSHRIRDTHDGATIRFACDAAED